MRRAHEMLGDRLDWNLLRTFLAVVQERGVSRAAERLHLTQPAVSLALKRLEDSLGCTLVERGAGRFRVTEAGELVYREAVAIYGNIARLGVAVRDTEPEVVGNVRLLLASRIQSQFFDRVLGEFHRQHPQVSFRIDVMMSRDIQQGLLQKTATAGLCLMRQPVAGIEREPFIRQTYRIYCGAGHPLFGRQNLSAADLRHENFVSFTSDQLGGALSPLALFRAQEGFEGQVVGVTGSLDEVRRMVRCGLGLGCLPEHAVAADVAEGAMWPLPPYEGVAEIDIFLAWPAEARFSQAERVFLDHVRSELAALPLERRLDAEAALGSLALPRP